MEFPTVTEFLEKSERLKYKVFDKDNKNFNLNIVGWRNKLGEIDKFCDILAVYWKENKNWKQAGWNITTRPGTPWLLNPINKSGAAILVPGQYLQSHELGVYKGYTALKQRKPVRVFRDNDRNGQWSMDPETIEEGLFGIHIHKAGMWSKLVGVHSAGCTVFAKSKDFNEFIDLCEMSKDIWGNKFTYTLMEF